MRRAAVVAVAVLLIAAAAAPPSAPTTAPTPVALKLLLKPVPDCTAPKPDEILVCGGRDRERERQTLPLPVDPEPGDPRTTSVSRERNALIEDNTGQGPINCGTAVGPFAGSGCLARDHRRAKEQEAGRGPDAPK